MVTNDDLSRTLDTSDEWIRTRTGIRERRIAAQEEALSDIAMPACLAALEQAGVEAAELDLIIVATVTPDMIFPSTAAILADRLGARDAAAYDLSAGCTGFMYALAQAYGMLAGGLSKRALIVGGDLLSKILDWSDRSTLRALRRRRRRGRARAGGRRRLPRLRARAPTAAAARTSGCRAAARATSTTLTSLLKMNGREVFKFATRVLVRSAEAVLEQCGLTIDDVDVYVPHQANVRIIDHAAK